MALYALDNVDDALDATRDFLSGLGRWAWLRLAVVVFFVGGVGSGWFPTGNYQVGGDGEPDPATPPADDLPTFDPEPDFWLLVAAVVLAVVLLGLALYFVAAVMEFVFVESLHTETVSVREYWSRHWRKGARLFGFRLAVNLLVAAAFALLGLLFFLPLFFDSAAIGVSLLVLLVLLPVFLVVAVVVGLFNGFTTMFVVPIMILEDRGVLAGWRRLWPTIRAQWKQYLGYAVGAFVLSLVAGFAFAIVTAILVVVLFVPFGILLGIGLALLTVAEPLGIGWLVLTGLPFALAVAVVAALVQVPVQTYLRYYALLVLGDVEDEFDIIPEQRAAVREPDESTDAA